MSRLIGATEEGAMAKELLPDALWVLSASDRALAYGWYVADQAE